MLQHLPCTRGARGSSHDEHHRCDMEHSLLQQTLRALSACVMAGCDAEHHNHLQQPRNSEPGSCYRLQPICSSHDCDGCPRPECDSCNIGCGRSQVAAAFRKGRDYGMTASTHCVTFDAISMPPAATMIQAANGCPAPIRVRQVPAN